MDQLPQEFQDKWTRLSNQNDPNDPLLTTLLGDLCSGILDNPNEGRRVDFKNGALLSYGFHTTPFLVHSDIYALWTSLGEANSPLGLPIADPQLLPDGSTCSIFEGGHVHKPPGTKEVVFVPAEKCTAPSKPTAPESLLNATPHWPPKFRNKWTALAPQRDPGDKQLGSLAGSTNFSWPNKWLGLADNENGGKMLHLTTGSLITYDHVTEPFLIYGKIYTLWSDLGGVKGGLGHPLADPKILPNGATCSVFVGGHIHQSGMKDAELVPETQCNTENQPPVPEDVWEGTQHWPPLFRNKWILLSTQRNHTDKQLASLLGPTDGFPYSWPGLTDNENDGKMLHFRTGRLISYDHVTEPFAIYGKIFDFWNDLGGLRSGLGHPISDPQFLPNGSTCNVFEGGHVHQSAMQDPEIVPASKCRIKNQPTVPEYVSLASTYWPKEFRDKWTWLACQRDRGGKQLATLMGPTDNFPHIWAALKSNNDLGGKTLHFRTGFLVSYDDSPPFLVYGKFADLWTNLGGIESGFGYPIADPQFLPDRSICIIFQGGHMHQLAASRDAEAYPADKCIAPHKQIVPSSIVNISPSWPHLFRQKWTSLSVQLDSSKTQLCSVLGATKPGLKVNSNGGKTLQFNDGMLVSIADDTLPYVVYGKIYAKWIELGGITGEYGRPLCDKRDLPDGGRCTVFEGGHIHKNGDNIQVGLTDCPVPVNKPTPVDPTVPAPPVQSPVIANTPTPQIQHTTPASVSPAPPAVPSKPPTYHQSPDSAAAHTQGYLHSNPNGEAQTPTSPISPQEQSDQSPPSATSTSEPHKGIFMSIKEWVRAAALAVVNLVGKGVEYLRDALQK